MKFIKIALLSIIGAGMLSACSKTDGPIDPGTAIVNFSENYLALEVDENEGLFSIPLDLQGEPGGWPVTVNIKTTVKVNGVEDPNMDINDILLITSTSIKITDANNSFVQCTPNWNPDDNQDYEVVLTIESANGAKIGENNTCTVTVKNVLAVKYGMYNFSARNGNGRPAQWTCILSEGSNGNYIMQNILGDADAPRLVGTFDPETMKISFDGTVNGFGNMLNKIGWGMKGEYQLYFMFGSGESSLVFDVNENYEMASTNNSFQLWTLALQSDGESYDFHELVGSFTGGGVLEYAGELSSEDEWPF